MPGSSLPPAESARLVLQSVSAGYSGKMILQDLSFEVPHGSQVAVVGPNGAGKSTLFKILVGLLPIWRGQVLVHGQPLGNHQDCVAYIPQREEVDWRFPVTVEDVVMMGRYGRFGWLRQPAPLDHQVVHHSMQQLGIENLARRPIGELSGGQQQRAFLARALAQEPHILLMDEPFNGIDAATQEATLELLRNLRAENVTVLVSTHDLNMAGREFDSILLLNHRLIAYGPAAQIFQPQIIAQAFGSQVLYLDGVVVVDECCPPGEGGHSHD